MFYRQRLLVLPIVVFLALLLFIHVNRTGVDITETSGTTIISSSSDSAEAKPKGCDFKAVVNKQKQCETDIDKAHSPSVTCSVMARAIICMGELMEMCSLSRESLAHAVRMLKYQLPKVCEEQNCAANVSNALDEIVVCKQQSLKNVDKCERVLSLKYCLMGIRLTYMCHNVLQDVILDEVPELKDTADCQTPTVWTSSGSSTRETLFITALVTPAVTMSM